MTAFHSLTNVSLDSLNFIELESSCNCAELKVERHGQTVRLPRPKGHSCSYVRQRGALVPAAYAAACEELLRQGISETDSRFGNRVSGIFSREMDQRWAAQVGK